MSTMTVLLIGLAIFRPDLKDPSQSEVGFGNKPGTTLHVKIMQQDKFIIDVDDKASKLLSFTDDKGTDLSKQKQKRFGQGWLASFPKIAEDGQSCIIEIRSDRLPKAEAGQITVKAQIALTCGSGEKTERVENVSLKPDITLNVGPMAIKIAKVGKPDWGNAKLNIQLSTKQNLANIKTVEFFDTDGQEIKSRQTGSMSSNNVVFMKSYNLDKKVDTATISVTYFEKVESVTVPIDIRASVGLTPVGSESESAVSLPTTVIQSE
ncbi:MAG: hypothetical protein GWP14_06515 [Actinobacteria bacterium]|nr:hypothetical protein [Actinomycetota bacterium]